MFDKNTGSPLLPSKKKEPANKPKFVCEKVAIFQTFTYAAETQ